MAKKPPNTGLQNDFGNDDFFIKASHGPTKAQIAADLISTRISVRGKNHEVSRMGRFDVVDGSPRDQ